MDQLLKWYKRCNNVTKELWRLVITKDPALYMHLLQLFWITVFGWKINQMCIKLYEEDKEQ